jgi:hypothetical protein
VSDGQLSHASLPVAAWKKPERHSEQPALPAPALYWPLAQSLHVPGAPPPQPECDEPAAQV